MNKTLNINLAGLIFHIDEDAFKQLERYLDTLKRQFRSTDGGNEIVSDIENRIAELFRERTSDSKEVISLEDVLEVIEIMGQPEDYMDPEEEPQTSTTSNMYTGSRRLLRDPDNKVIGGVSSGVAAYFNIDAVWIRLLFVLLFFTGPGFLIYLVMWIVIPKAKSTAEKLMMRGEPVNISNIQKSIKEEFTDERGEFRYRKTRDGIGGFFNELGRFLFDAIRLIIKFIIKVVGFFLLFIGFIMLFSIVMSLVVGSVEINGANVGLQYVLEFMKLVTENESHYNMLIVSIMLSVAAPVFLLIYFGIRILFNLDPLNRPTKSGLAFMTLIGLVLLAIATTKIAHKFQDESYVTYDLSVPEGHKQFYLTTSQDSISSLFDEDYNFNMHWLPLGEENAFNMVDVNVEPTDEELPFIKVRRESRGVSRMQARNNAENLEYEVLFEDSVITVPVYYLLTKDQKFRAQNLDIDLYLPVGYSVYLDHSLAEYLYDVDNVQNMWDNDMVGTLWHMTEDGLSCDGCDVPLSEDEDSWYENEEYEFGDEESESSDSTEAPSAEEDQEESEDLVFHDYLSDDSESLVHTNVFLMHIAKPIEDKVKKTTLNILRNSTLMQI